MARGERRYRARKGVLGFQLGERMRTMILLFLSLGTASAATVVHDGKNAEVATRLVSEATGDPVDALRPVAFADLLVGRAPTVLGGARLTGCVGTAAGMDTVRESLAIAEGAVSYMEYGSARSALDTAARSLGCLREPVVVDVAARAYFLRGVVAMTTNDTPTARASFRSALAIKPDLAFDPNAPTESRAVFESVRQEVAGLTTVGLRVVPAGPGAVLVNGKPLTAEDGRLSIVPGKHLLQLGGSTKTTMQIEIDANSEPVLVLPGNVPPSAISWIADEARREDLASLLAAILGREESVYLVVDNRAWRARLGGSAWDALGATPAGTVAAATNEPITSGTSSEAQVAPRSKKPVSSRTVVLVAGVTTSVVGGVLVGIGAASGSDAVSHANTAISGNDPDSFSAAQAEYESASTLQTVGWIVGGVGLAATSLGLVLKPSESTAVSLVPTPGGAYASLTLVPGAR